MDEAHFQERLDALKADRRHGAAELARLALGVLAASAAADAADAPALRQVLDGRADRLVAAMLAETPVVEDLRSLTDEIGGRPTGSPANVASVAWAVDRFRAAGVEAWAEAFAMPMLWLERHAAASIRSADGDVVFRPRIAAMPFSTATPTNGPMRRSWSRSRKTPR